MYTLPFFFPDKRKFCSPFLGFEYRVYGKPEIVFFTNVMEHFLCDVGGKHNAVPAFGGCGKEIRSSYNPKIFLVFSSIPSL